MWEKLGDMGVWHMGEIGRNACVTCGEKWVAHVAAASEGALLLLRFVEQRLGARRQRQVSLGGEGGGGNRKESKSGLAFERERENRNWNNKGLALESVRSIHPW